MTALVQNIADELFNKYLTSDDKCNLEFESINNHLGMLGLINKDCETLKRYKNIITDKYLLAGHFDVLRLLKNDAFLNESLEKKAKGGYKTKLIRSNEHRILLLRKLEEFYNIGPLEVNFARDKYKTLEEGIFKNIKYVFDTKKKSPANDKELRELYVFMIKQLSNKEIITSVRSKKRNEDRDTVLYKLNDKFINYHIELSKHNTKNYKNYQAAIVLEYELPVLENKPAVRVGDNFDCFRDLNGRSWNHL